MPRRTVARVKMEAIVCHMVACNVSLDVKSEVRYWPGLFESRKGPALRDGVGGKSRVCPTVLLISDAITVSHVEDYQASERVIKSLALNLSVCAQHRHINRTESSWRPP